MGNFDPLFAEIRRRRRNNWAVSALCCNFAFFVAVLSSPLVLPA